MLEKFEGIQFDVPLSKYTTWRIGGNAKYFLEPINEEQVCEVLALCKKEEIKVHFLGRGSNVLIDDKGINGLVICTKKSFQKIHHNEGKLVAQSGVPLPMISKYASNLGYTGFEFLIGIPGNVGGGVVINAGLSAKKRVEISDIFHSARIIDLNGDILVYTKEGMDFDYRKSSILNKDKFVLDASFNLRDKGDSEQIKDKVLSHLKDRKSKQPLTKPTAGSTFKQPEGGMSAGWYIEKAGLKGLKVGQAMISLKHANWIENLGNAKSNDVKSLIEKVTEEVYKNFDILLEQEVTFLD